MSTVSGLVAVLGGGVAELDVFGDVVGGEDGVTGAVSGGDVEGAVVDGSDGPQFAVADGFAGGGVDLAVVAAGDNDVAGMGVLSVSDRGGHGRVELTGGGPCSLDGVVDQVDVLVRCCGDGDCFVVLVAVEPQVGDVVEVFVELAGVDASVSDVGVDGCGVTVS